MAAAFRTFYGRMEFSVNVRNELTGPQGINSGAELAKLTDKQVSDLCKVIRKEGGPGPGGLPISLRAEMNMQLAAYYCRFRQKTSRPIVTAQLTIDNIETVRALREWEQNHKDVEAPADIIHKVDWNKTLEGIQEFLRGNLGVTKIPLAYVIRDTEAPEADPAGGWPTLQDELIGRAPIRVGGNFTATFKTDNGKVWELISKICRDKACWTYIMSHQRTRSGRGAFLALKAHYLGDNAVGNMAIGAETKLQNFRYQGEKRGWNFEKYVSSHVEQHQILENQERRGLHPGINERSKVQHLLKGIQSQEFETCRLSIMSKPELLTDFSGAVNLIKDYIAQKNLATDGTPNQRNVSAVGTGGGNGEGKRRIQAADVTDRYYTRDEYKLLTQDARAKLHKLREKRGHDPTKTPARKPTQAKHKLGDHDFKKAVKFMSTIASVISDKQQQNESEGDSESEDDQSLEEDQGRGRGGGGRLPNRSNPALRRTNSRRL